MDIFETERGLAASFFVKSGVALHARPSAKLAQTARQFDANILFINENGEVDAKSMLDILTLAPESNSTITILAKGSDAREAITALYNLLTSYQL